jgi:predicted nuclease of restriction endonuclease-like (RecB) superfamily
VVARQAIENGWSRNVLVHQIESGLFERQGGALTNFSRTLPAEQSELAQQILKDRFCRKLYSAGGRAMIAGNESGGRA